MRSPTEWQAWVKQREQQGLADAKKLMDAAYKQRQLASAEEPSIEQHGYRALPAGFLQCTSMKGDDSTIHRRIGVLQKFRSAESQVSIRYIHFSLIGTPEDFQGCAFNWNIPGTRRARATGEPSVPRFGAPDSGG